MRVLHVEEDSATPASIAVMPRAEDFIVDTADLGEDRLKVGKLYDYDTIILDLMPPDIDGCEVLPQLRGARVQRPIIDVFTRTLRKKLSQATGDESSIETVWGGYVLRDPAGAIAVHELAHTVD